MITQLYKDIFAFNYANKAALELSQLNKVMPKLSLKSEITLISCSFTTSLILCLQPHYCMNLI